MIFEIKNKLPHNADSYLHSEDVLTGTVFGYLRYFSNQNLLRRFLYEAHEVGNNNNHFTLESNKDFDIKFWKIYDGIEPDLRLENDFYDIIIECKYYSLLSGGDQLIKYSKLLNPNKKRVIILLTRTQDYSYLKEDMERSRKDIEQNIGLYYLSWQRLHFCMKDAPDKNLPENEKRLFNDLMAFLEKRCLVAFFGIEPPQNISLNWHYKKHYLFLYDATISWHYRKPYGFQNISIGRLWRYKNGRK
jgi:hypothetical protein